MVFKVKSAAKAMAVPDEPAVAYNTLGENSPLKKNRYPTDVFFISIFVLTFLSWLGCAVYVICFQAPSNINVTSDTALIEFNDDERKYDRIIDVVCAILSSPNLAVLGFMFLAAGLMFLCIILLKSPVSKVFVYTAVIGIGISVCLSFLSFGLNFIAIFMTLYSGFNSESYDITVLIINGTIMTIQCIYQLTVFTCISKVGVNYLTEIIKESCRVLFYYCSLSIFASSLLIFHLLVLLLTVKVYVTLQMFDGMLICHFINIIGGAYMLLFITFFGEMVIAESIATWYWTMNKDTIPKFTVFRSVSSTTQNHLGTISYGATFIFPMLQGVYLSAKAKVTEENSDTAIIRFIAKIMLTLDVVECSLIQTAIHGHEFAKSAKKSFDLVLRNSSRYLAIINTSACVIFVVLSIIATIVCIAMIAVLQPVIDQYKDLSPDQAVMVLISILALVLIVILPYFLLMVVSIKTVLLCTFEDVLENNGSTEKPYYMNFKLQKMLTE